MVPGALAVARDLDGFARLLGARFSVHTIERRGRGESGDRPDAYSIDRECEDEAALQAATGATLVFGHSFGGLLPTAIREHLAAARLDGPDTRYKSMTAKVVAHAVSAFFADHV